MPPGLRAEMPFCRYLVGHLDHAHHYPSATACWRHLRAVAQDWLYDLFHVVLPDILAEIAVGVGIQLDGQ